MVPRSRNPWDVIVIGGGIAGLTALVQAARRGLSVSLIEREVSFGGQVSTVNALHDWPAVNVTSGVELAAALAHEARQLGANIVVASASAMTANADHVDIETSAGSHRGRRILLATGARLKSLGVAGEEALRGKGVSQCAHCDAHFFRNEDVVVVGGGDAALQEALVLAKVCRSVTIVTRGALRARRAYVEHAAALDHIVFRWASQVTAILGDQNVTGVRVQTAGETSPIEMVCSGVFPFVGVTPDSDFVSKTIALDANGGVTTDRDYRTTVPSIFAVGAVRSGYRGDLVSAAGEAASAMAVIANELGS
ncbi:MAG: NAD(P)/FAD-dependent oxidoreductase [Burkholderiales bacterium]